MVFHRGICLIGIGWFVIVIFIIIIEIIRGEILWNLFLYCVVKFRFGKLINNFPLSFSRNQCNYYCWNYQKWSFGIFLFIHGFPLWVVRVIVVAIDEWKYMMEVRMEGWVWREWEYKSGVVWSECLRYSRAEERTNERDVEREQLSASMVTKKQMWSGRGPVESWIDASVAEYETWNIKYMYFVISIKSISN